MRYSENFQGLFSCQTQVSGILPVVGVPLPFMSYGGTALLILGICCGLLMKISAQRRIKVSLYGDDYRS